MTSKRRQHHHVVNKSTREDYSDSKSHRDPETEIAHVWIDERTATEIVNKDQQRETTEPRRTRFPAKPVQRARNEVGRLSSLNHVKAAAMDHPHLRSRAAV